ncbi:hypothetical protein EVAR_36802_1 [Eumeta japonica]|uniref:Craniofacial development protein 2 n=1 Tax=Eumeta variegata TaxID=151549 RepID=A0A4C1WYQ2_EUMVA|nr:hypothetical protein EVAR_36802_1 [Eumeta japonica]
MTLDVWSKRRLCLLTIECEVQIRTTAGGYCHYQRIPLRASPGNAYRIWVNKFSYRGIGSSRLDYDDEVCLLSRLVRRRGEMRTEEVRFGTLNICGDMDDKIDDLCELIKYKRLNIRCVNETKRKDTSKLLEVREEFWAEMREILVKCDKNERIVILGNCNGWVSVQRDGYEKALGKFGDERANENCDCLLLLCQEFNLCVTNTMFDHKRHTHISGKEEKTKTFIIVNNRLRSNGYETVPCRSRRNDDGHLLNEENNVKESWKNYFDSVFAYEDTVADENIIATEYIIDDGNENEIVIDEIIKALKCMKVGKAAGYDRVLSEMLRGGGSIVISLLY